MPTSLAPGRQRADWACSTVRELLTNPKGTAKLHPEAAAAFSEALDAPATVNERLASALARPQTFQWLD